MRNLFILIVLFSSAIHGMAQYREVARYNTADGLPTNFIYNCVEDGQGFLWIATDQGAIRYDGRQFQRFTTSEGLPDNEVLKVLREQDGTIWIHSFKQTPAYFDNLKNRFISAKEDTLLKNISSRRLLVAYNTLEGGVNFSSEMGSAIFSGRRRFDYDSRDSSGNYLLTLSHLSEQNYLTVSASDSNDGCFINHYDHGVLKESKQVCKGGFLDVNRGNIIYNGHLYCYLRKTPYHPPQLICLSNIKIQPLRFDRKILSLHKEANHIWITSQYIVLIYTDRHYELYDAETLDLKQTIKADYTVNSVFEDTRKGLWVCTSDEGIIKLENPVVSKMNLAKFSEFPCFTIAPDTTNTIFIATGNNQVLEINRQNTISHQLPGNPEVASSLKDILFSRDKVFTFSDAGCYVNFTRPIPDPVSGRLMNGKAAVVLNDSAIIIGRHDRLCYLNTRTEQTYELPNLQNRVTSMVAWNSDIVYYGSVNGLHKYDLRKKADTSLASLNPLLEERIISLCKTSDSIIWIATAGNGVVALRHDRVISHLTKQQGLITNSLRTICTGKPGQVIVGTNEGLSFIDYSGSITYPVIKNLTVSDGLSSNIINKIVYLNDTVYAAGGLGISVIPTSASATFYEIPVRLMGVRINQQDQLIANHYKLKPGNYNINLLFGGIELNGHFRNAQLSVDEGATWTDVENNRLSLQLGSGEHPVWLRAVDMNRYVSKQVLKLQFSISTPFYTTWWFVFLLFATILIACLYLYIVWTRKKHTRQLSAFKHQNELDQMEIQALKSQINPHFVFNCLNSIQGFIYDEDFENADIYLRKFSDILRSTLNYSSQSSISLEAELDYIQTYLSLEKLRFGNKINYEIEIPDELPSREIQLPAMLLQPFVENAIHHGLGLLSGSVGELRIKVYLTDKMLHIIIDDNGVGRKKAEQWKQLQMNMHESKGTKLTQRRLDLYHIALKIIDKIDSDGKATGTTIHIEIPVPLHQLTTNI